MNEITQQEITPENTAIILQNIQHIGTRLDRMTGTLDRMISRLEKNKRPGKENCNVKTLCFLQGVRIFFRA